MTKWGSSWEKPSEFVWKKFQQPVPHSWEHPPNRNGGGDHGGVRGGPTAQNHSIFSVPVKGSASYRSRRWWSSDFVLLQSPGWLSTTSQLKGNQKKASNGIKGTEAGEKKIKSDSAQFLLKCLFIIKWGFPWPPHLKWHPPCPHPALSLLWALLLFCALAPT